MFLGNNTDHLYIMFDHQFKEGSHIFSCHFREYIYDKPQ